MSYPTFYYKSLYDYVDLDIRYPDNSVLTSGLSNDQGSLFGYWTQQDLLAIRAGINTLHPIGSLIHMYNTNVPAFPG